MKTLKAKLFEMDSYNNANFRDEIERELSVDTKHHIGYKERIVAINKRNVLVCEMVQYQQTNNGEYPYRNSWQERTVKKINRKYLRNNAYWSKKEEKNWEVLLEQWTKKESQIKQKDMNDLSVLIDEKRKALVAMYKHKRLGNFEKVKSIQNHVEYLQERIQRVHVQSVVIKKSGKYYTKRNFTTGY